MKTGNFFFEEWNQELKPSFFWEEMETIGVTFVLRV
jgi:hypothetical protein